MIGEPTDKTLGNQFDAQEQESPALEEETQPEDPKDEVRENGWYDETESLSASVVDFLITNADRFGLDIDDSGIDSEYHVDLRNGDVRQVLVYYEESQIQNIKVTFTNSRTEVFLMGTALQAFLESPTE